MLNHHRIITLLDEATSRLQLALTSLENRNFDKARRFFRLERHSYIILSRWIESFTQEQLQTFRAENGAFLESALTSYLATSATLQSKLQRLLEDDREKIREIRGLRKNLATYQSSQPSPEARIEISV